MLKMIEFGLLGVTLLIVFGLAAATPRKPDPESEQPGPAERP